MVKTKKGKVMDIKKLILVPLVLVFMVTGGCASHSAKIRKITDGAYLVDYDASRRGAYVHVLNKERELDTIICAEPAPDVALAMTVSLQAHLKALLAEAETLDASANLQISEAIIDLARRGQTLQIQREALYRLCELQSNAGLTKEETIALFNEILVAVKAIAIVEVAESDISDFQKGQILSHIMPGIELEPK